MLGCMGIDIALAKEDSNRKTVLVLALDCIVFDVMLAIEDSKDLFAPTSVDCDGVGVVLAIHCSEGMVSLALDCIGSESEPAALVCKDWALVFLKSTLVGVVFTDDDGQIAVAFSELSCIAIGAVLAEDDRNDVVPLAPDCNVAGVVFMDKSSEDVGP